MALPSSGQLSIGDIRTELGSSSGSLRTLSAAAGKSTPDAISEFYGYSNVPNAQVSISGNVVDYGWYSTGGTGDASDPLILVSTTPWPDLGQYYPDYDYWFASVAWVQVNRYQGQQFNIHWELLDSAWPMYEIYNYTPFGAQGTPSTEYLHVGCVDNEGRVHNGNTFSPLYTEAQTDPNGTQVTTIGLNMTQNMGFPDFSRCNTNWRSSVAFWITDV